MHTTYKMYNVAHVNNVLLYNISSSLPGSLPVFPSCIATCSDLAGFQCELIFSPFSLLQNLILMPSGHNKIPVALQKHRAIFRFPCMRMWSIISPNFTAIIYSAILSCQLFGLKSLINMSDCFANTLLCLSSAEISTFHNRPPETVLLSVSDSQALLIRLFTELFDRKQTQRPFSRPNTAHAQTIVCVHTTIHNCALSQ